MTKLYALGCLAAMAFIGCQHASNTHEQTETAIPVVIQQLTKSSDQNTIRLSGNVEGNKTVRLGFMVAGKINYIAANEGQRVNAGQLLASLDPQSYGYALDAANASLNQVQDEYDRLKIMHERKSLSESDFSKVSNTLEQAKAQRNLQQKNVKETKLYVPFNGVLLKKNAEVGEIVNTGMPLFVVADIQQVKVNAAVPESELRSIRLGQESKVYIPSLDTTFTGKVVEVGSAADATTRAFTVKMELKNPQLLIRPGMIAELQTTSATRSEMMVLPAEAVLHDTDNSTYVFIADTARHQAFKRKVTLGRLVDNKIEITSGINENEQVVTGGQQKLHDGVAITIK
ncbi:efflux RND transporter periplasmic adaptor subunit [Chitinophaga pendula]|uniref:efflux RND transporter periplasmic adaptor subunit n=1 Tax=Chitinophaga TaxID=79328 RepID=UPI000BAFBFF0|nr:MULTISPECIES: efflux RND transporter periplasmic adaptor subunit [Chitinophaga]ASZ13847.1 efflux transporter periplasmic adaptor subunit [Chitinophaga sp. MD30]UCJ08530.1 efflux RND transporter periplasmic adaptor subunit [Chitinophaga pendula]